MDRSQPLSGLLRSSLLAEIILVFLVLVIPPKVSANDTWVFYPTEVEAFLRYDSIDQEGIKNSDLDSHETDFELGVSLTQEGHVLDPDIAWFLLDIEPAYTKSKNDSDSFEEERKGDIVNYLFQLGLLKGTPGPLGFNVEAQRSSSLITGDLGSRFDNVVESKQLSANWKNQAFPMMLSYEEELLEQDFTASQSNVMSQRNEFLKSWTLSGSSSKMKLRVDRKELDDRVIERDNDYELDQASLYHNLPWGRDSELQSRLTYYDRVGFIANERISLQENARIRHTDNIFSRFIYRFHSVKQNIETDDHFTRYEFNHKLYKNLNTTASLDFNTRKSEDFDEEIMGTDIKNTYRKNNFLGASVHAGLGLGYRETDRETSQGLLDIVDESHVVPLSGAIILNNRFILTTTIVVTNDNSTLAYVEGLDYEVNSLAGNLTEIETIPGGRINQNDTILVSYQSQALPSQEFSTTQTNYNFGINLGGFRFSHSDSKSNDDLISEADESFLSDTRYTFTDLEYRWEIANNDLLLSAERRFTRTGDFESTTYTYQQLLTWTHNHRIRTNLNLTESFTQQAFRDNDLYSLDLSVDWRPKAALSVRLMIGFWTLKDRVDPSIGQSRDDEFITTGFRLHWKYRLINMDFSYFHNQRKIDQDQTTGESKTRQDRIQFNLTRRFL